MVTVKDIGINLIISMKTKNILVTGGLGFIGFHLAAKIQREPQTSLTIVDNLTRGRLDNEAKKLVDCGNVDFLNLDLTEKSSFDKLRNDFDEIYHFAAVVGVDNVLSNPSKVLNVNTLSTINLLNWFISGEKGKLLFPSTSEAYAWTQKFYELPIPTPENVPLALVDMNNPRLSYAGSKIFNELCVNTYCQQYNKSYCVVRYHNVYGPRMGYSHVIPQLVRKLIVDKPKALEVFSPDFIRSFCYIEDAVDCTLRAVRQNNSSDYLFNIGDDSQEIKIRELAKRIIQICDANCDILEKIATNDPIPRRCPNIELARIKLGYTPKNSLSFGLKETVEWYLKDYAKA